MTRAPPCAYPVQLAAKPLAAEGQGRRVVPPPTSAGVIGTPRRAPIHSTQTFAVLVLAARWVPGAGSVYSANVLVVNLPPKYGAAPGVVVSDVAGV